MKHYYTYIISNASRMLYVGVTNDLMRRMSEHRQKLYPGYAARYNLKQLVYYEASNSIESAIAREKQIKGWARGRKDALIESMNPERQDLCAEWFRQGRGTVLGEDDAQAGPSAEA
jgi:putative endonuclease